MGKVAFIFSGQGAQYVGMGKEICKDYESSEKIFDEASKSLSFDLKNLCFNGPEDKLNSTEITQPAVLTTSIAMLQILKDEGIKPDVVAGLSLGEYSALVCSEVLDFKTAVKLVNKRGKFMQEAVPKGKGTMAAILGLSQEDVRKTCLAARDKGIVEPANYNCPGQVVIGGEIEAVKLASDIALKKGAKRAIELPVSAPFHTSMLHPAKEKLEGELSKIKLEDMKIPVITNVTADYIKNTSDIKHLLAKQVVSPVLWEDTIRKMISDGVDTFVEIGPGKSLSGFVKKVNRKLNILNLESEKSFYKTLDLLGGKAC